MVEHSALTGGDLHEPKGVAAAPAGRVYRSNGAGSGTWSLIDTGMLDSSSIFVNRFVSTFVFDDISTAESFVVSFPFACLLSRARITLHGAITTADAVVTFTNSTGPTTIGTQTITFADSGEGVGFTFTPVSNNTFSANTFLKVATDGASSGVSKATVVLEYIRIGA